MKPLTKEQIKMMQEEMVTAVVELLMKRRHLSLKEAIREMYSSRLFENLQDERTGLYYQSPGYLYSFLETNSDR
jgi:ClpP class serine protease